LRKKDSASCSYLATHSLVVGWHGRQILMEFSFSAANSGGYFSTLVSRDIF